MDSTTQTILARAWTSLVDAAAEQSPLTLGYFGTVGLDGTPQVRAVIIRGADVEAGTVYFASRAASTKIEEVDREPRAALTFFDESAQIQIRMTGRAEVAIDSEAGEGADPYAFVGVRVDSVDVLDLSGAERIRHIFSRDGETWDGVEAAA